MPADTVTDQAALRTAALATAPPGPAALADGRSALPRTGQAPRITGVGVAVPPRSYSQHEVLDLLQVTDPRIRGLFQNSAIDQRGLSLPPPGPDGRPRPETQGELLGRHVATGTAMGREAVLGCLQRSGAGRADVRYLCCVSSTGFITPGFSALLIRELGLSRDCGRLDVVGMGCNAGLNALAAVTGWAGAHPGQLAVLACIEACSAAYVFDGSMRTAVVNSLFGDGAAAITVLADPGAGAASGPADGPATAGPAANGLAAAGPEVLGFASHIIPDAIGAMRYDWDGAQGKFSFFIDPEVPYVVGAHADRPVGRLLADAGLRPSDIAHWLVHSGGKKVIDAIRVNLGLTRHDLRHTTGVLRDHGNLSSGSFLFSYQRLLEEGVAAAGDHGVMMTMGPGSTIETALLRW